MPPVLSDLPFTAAEIAAAQAANRMLHWAPRFRVDGWRLRAGQEMLALSQRGGEARLGRSGVAVQVRTIAHEDHETQVRILRGPDAPTGVLLDIHGGGWVFGNAAMNDVANARFIRQTGVAVVSVDYRLVSRERAVGIVDALDDCAAAAGWLIDHAARTFGTDRLLITGESAGGHLAALALLRLRDAGLADRFRGAVLLYGAFDLNGTASVQAADHRTLLLNGPTMLADLRNLAKEGADPRIPAPDASPLRADLTGLPPALFVVGGLDPLLDDSRLMAERWAQVAPAELLFAPESPHGFTQFPGGLAKRVNARIQAWIRDHLR